MAGMAAMRHDGVVERDRAGVAMGCRNTQACGAFRSWIARRKPRAGSGSPGPDARPAHAAFIPRVNGTQKAPVGAVENVGWRRQAIRAVRRAIARADPRIVAWTECGEDRAFVRRGGARDSCPCLDDGRFDGEAGRMVLA